VLAVHIAAEDRDAADAEAQREERLVHRFDDHLEDADMLDRGGVGVEVKAHPLRRARQEERPDAEPEEQHEKTGHQPLGDPLHPGLEPDRAHRRAEQHGERHVADHLDRILQERAEMGPDPVGVQPGKRARSEFAGVGDHPAGDRGVEDHQHHVAEEENRARPVPFEPFVGGERFVGAEDVAAARPPQRQLHDHDRKTEREQKPQIDQNEDRPAVLSADEREAPDVAEADRAAGGQKNEADPGTEILPGGAVILHVVSPNAVVIPHKIALSAGLFKFFVLKKMIQGIILFGLYLIP